jgi:hypothetical protein
MFATLALIGTSWASPTSIGVFFDAEATDCDVTATQYMPFMAWVYAILGTDAAAEGIIAAEFRIDEIGDIEWSFHNKSRSKTRPLGDPGRGGCKHWVPALYAGQRASQCGTSLHDHLHPNEFGIPRIVQVSYRPTPADHHWGPLATLCDAPLFTKIVVGGGEARINSGPCTVGVEQVRWSSLKAMYRD